MKKADNSDLKIRYPTQSGRFYAADSEQLKNQIEECFLHRLGPGKLPKISNKTSCDIIGLICPHAGYMFSGPIAAHAYYSLAVTCKPETIIILGPNHTGYGSAVSLMNTGQWQTPLGNVEVNKEIANFIANKTQIVDVDELAHRFEHSIEVQLPFLQYLFGSNFNFVPICLQMQDLVTISELGKTLAEVLYSKKAIIIASSDMTHYQPHKETVIKDIEALRAVEELNEKKFYNVLESRNITACGFGPIATLIFVANKLNGKKAKLLCYKTSGDITSDYSSVVGYAAMSFQK